MPKRDPFETTPRRRASTTNSKTETETRQPFDGFPKEGKAFFRELAKKQDREWFHANKHRYESLWAQPLQALVRDVSGKLASTFPEVETAKPKFFRLYRDTRFSTDKTPFKTHAAAVLPLYGGSVMEGTGLYMHFGADEAFVVAGRWTMDKGALERFRAYVGDDATGAQGAKLIAKAERDGFSPEAHESLKRVPPPYPADHPRAEILKRKGLALSFPKHDRSIEHSTELVKWIATHTKKIAPLLDWIEEACT